MQMEKIVIVGIGNTGKNIYDMVTRYNLYDVIGFAVNEEYKTNDFFCEKPLFTIENLENEIDKNEVKLFVAVLWNRLNADRRNLYLSLKAKNYQFVNIISPKALVHGLIKGENCWINDFAFLKFGAIIHDNVFMDAYSVVGHRSEIESHCFLGMKSTVGGACRIGEQTFIGLNCTVFEKTIIGEKCLLGACAVVKRNMPNYSSIKTSSDMVIKQYDENVIEQKLLYHNSVR
jgi:sugar O-acyltransferase (sialic acid O-acetyltransferase NeuD family)